MRLSFAWQVLKRGHIVPPCVTVATLLPALNIVMALPQQDAPAVNISPQIRGSLLELGTDRPIAGVDIRIGSQEQGSGPRDLFSADSTNVLTTTKTGADGRFSVTVPEYGTYRIQVRKDGWSPVASVFQPPINSTSTTLTKERPQRDLTFVLARPGQITGRAFDVLTNAPIPVNSLMMAWQTTYRDGHLITAFPAQIVRTESNGKFLFNSLPPGRYVLAIAPQKRGAARILREFSDKDVDVVDTDFEPTFWPGGLDLTSVVPVNVGSGAYVSVGDLNIRTAKVYRAHGTVGGCESGENFWLYESHSRTSLGERIGGVNCDESFLLTGLPADLYRIAVVSKVSHKSALAEILVKDKAARLSLMVRPGLKVDVEIKSAEGSSKVAHNGIKIEFRPSSFFSGGQIVGSVDDEGKLSLDDLSPGEYRIQVVGIPRGTTSERCYTTVMQSLIQHCASTRKRIPTHS